MILRLLRRHNRAVTLVSGVGLCLYFLLPNPDVARGALIGGLLAIFYLGLLQEQLEGGWHREPARLRGRLFGTLLLRLALLAVGLGIALWLSRTAFWSAVVALGIMYVFLVLAMSRELRRGKGDVAPSLADTPGDGTTGLGIEGEDDSAE